MLKEQREYSCVKHRDYTAVLKEQREYSCVKHRDYTVMFVFVVHVRAGCAYILDGNED